MLPISLLGSDDDWQENVRQTLYPWLHPRLESLGNMLGVPLYACGHVGFNQYVGHTHLTEEALEQELVHFGFRRNPMAALKELPDGRVSEGSWVLLSEDSELVDDGMQVHVTMFDRDDQEDGRVIYAHYEDDWRVRAIAHLQGLNFDAKAGVERARCLLQQSKQISLVVE